MNTRPLASVQMVTYNHAPFIKRAVEGVLSQKAAFPFELVIGEDCSPDGTRDIALDYERRYPDRVRVVTSDKNVGLHPNVLRTQEACRGEYLLFCEGDDWWHDPSKLQTQVDFLDQHPDYGLVHCNYDTFEVAANKLKRGVIHGPNGLQDDNAFLEIMLRKRRILTLTVCVRRSLLDRVVKEQPECTDRQWPMGDTQRWLEISRLAKVKYFPQSMATYNYLPESASQSRDPAKAFRFSEKAGQLILHYLKKYPVEEQHDRRIRARVATELVAAAYGAKDREKVAFWLEQLRATGRPVPLDARLCWLATQGTCARLAAKPSLWFLTNGRRARDRVVRLYREQLRRPSGAVSQV